MVTLGVISMMVLIMIDCALCQTEIEQPACKVRIVTPGKYGQCDYYPACRNVTGRSIIYKGIWFSNKYSFVVL